MGIFDLDNYAGATRIDIANRSRRCVGVRALRSPVVHKFRKWIVPARRGFRTTPHAIGILILLILEQREELLRLARFMEVLEGHVEDQRDDYRSRCNRRAHLDQPVSPGAVLFFETVCLEITSHRRFYFTGLARS